MPTLHFLGKGVTLNLCQSLVAEAINYNSIRFCKLLLEHGAYSNSVFEVQREKFLPENISQNYKDQVRTGKETALHAAYRIGSQGPDEVETG